MDTQVIETPLSKTQSKSAQRTAQKPVGFGAGLTVAEGRVARQRTLKSSIHCSGVGLHSGAKVNMTLHPAEPDSGLVFHRSDTDRVRQPVAALWKHAVETPLCTTLVAEDGSKVMTVEHLLAALAGLGIDNLVIELDGPEVPIMDGSSAPFVFLAECAGVIEQDAPRRAIKILRPIGVSEPHRSATLTPGEGFSVDFEIDFDNRAIARQDWSINLSPTSFKREVCRARTFGFLEEVDQLRAAGLARGGSLDNAVVISGERVLNEGGLRYPNEFVRHKVLDSVGDLYLAGAPIIGHFRGVRTGHALNLRLVSAMMADESAWCWSSMPEPQAEPLTEGGLAAPLRRAVAQRA